MIRLPRYGLVFLFCVLILFPNCTTTEIDPTRPNIVLIIVDDLGWADVSYHGSTTPTPNIDRLASEGVELDRFYTSPLCSPTRAGLLTGRYPIRYGMARSVITPWRRFGLDPRESTIAEVLERAGYVHRGLFGKWHLGHLDAKWHPLAAGFTHFRGHYNGAIDYFTHRRMGERDWHVDYTPTVEEGYTTDLIADAAATFIRERTKEGAYLCVVSFNAPHIPLQAPTSYIGDVAQPSPDDVMSAMIRCLDDGIGRVLDAIDRSGAGKNTLVWFLSDNGGIREFVASNLPLRGGKLDVFEGGVRVPASVRWPAGISGGRKIVTPTAYIDVLPTIMEIAQLPAPGEDAERPLDGESLLGLLSGSSTPPDRDLFFYHGHEGPMNEQMAVITPEWKLVVLGSDITEGVGDMHEVLLFRIGDDPYERHNVADEHPEIVDALTKKLIAHHSLQPPDGVPPFDVGRDDFVPPKKWEIRRPR